MIQPDFFNTRIEYLKKLPNIGSNWIAGGGRIGGIAPNDIACGYAIDTLIFFRDSEIDLSFNDILIGPIPDGGVCLEIRSKVFQCALNLLNTGVGEVTFATEGQIWEESVLPIIDAVLYFQKVITIGMHQNTISDLDLLVSTV